MEFTYRVIKMMWAITYIYWQESNLIVTEKLNAHHCKEQLKRVFFSFPMKYQYVLSVALHTSSRYRLRAKHFVIKSLPVFTVAVRIRSFQVSVSKAEEEGVFEEFSTHLAVVHSTHGSPDVLTSLDFADKPVEYDRLFPHSYSVGLNSSPYRCNLCT
jgi:hypothetical protein